MRPQRVLFVGLTALALVAGACGGGGDSKASDLAIKDPKAAMAAAATRTAEAKTVRLALVTTNESKLVVSSGTGVYDFRNKSGRFKLKTVNLGVIDVLFSPTEGFLKIPEKTPSDPGWVRGGDNAQSAAFFDSIRKQADPRSTLERLGTNLVDIKKIGSQKIRKVDTTHLRGRVDLSDAAIAKAPESARADLQAGQKAFGAKGYVVNLWLDSEGRVRRVQYDIASAEGDTKSTLEVRYDLYDFGKAPGIKLPAADDVTDAASLTTTTTAAGK